MQGHTATPSEAEKDAFFSELAAEEKRKLATHDDLVRILKEAVESGALRYVNQECCGNGVYDQSGGMPECCGLPLDLDDRARATLSKAGAA